MPYPPSHATRRFHSSHLSTPDTLQHGRATSVLEPESLHGRGDGAYATRRGIASMQLMQKHKVMTASSRCKSPTLDTRDTIPQVRDRRPHPNPGRAMTARASGAMAMSTESDHGLQCCRLACSLTSPTVCWGYPGTHEHTRAHPHTPGYAWTHTWVRTRYVTPSRFGGAQSGPVFCYLHGLPRSKLDGLNDVGLWQANEVAMFRDVLRADCRRRSAGPTSEQGRCERRTEAPWRLRSVVGQKESQEKKKKKAEGTGEQSKGRERKAKESRGKQRKAKGKSECCKLAIGRRPGGDGEDDCHLIKAALFFALRIRP
ncbi:hypothetical protein K431DRAFT_27798 [Polychaeton citri CBS 116435]|uniref:Uncharacterized protein n=1 Tax=Polychaeton citri CBS 116435 TaxID=1314669 RepID=A0A9P4QE91_9PEZI|nr:hypothetical protein K431DRAFT_27798 [Polychaeton citri CBS 116435]